MSFRLPQALQTDDNGPALHLLHRYFGASGPAYLGAEFDTWGKPDDVDPEPDRFTADDVVALSFLSVPVGGLAARQLLRDRAGQFTQLLTELGADRELADEAEPLDGDWVGWRLMTALRDLDDVGPTRASKLLARKRPKLRPIYDTVVAKVTATEKHQWEPVRQALRDQDHALQQRLERLHQADVLAPAVPALRVLDVVAWMEGKDQGL